MVKYLGDKGAQLDQQGMFTFSVYCHNFINSICSGRNGYSALILAASLGHSDIVRYLGDKKAQLELKSMFLVFIYFSSFINSDCLDEDGHPAFIVAASKGHSDIVKYLGDKGVALDFQGMFPFSVYCNSRTNSLSLDRKGNSALILAASNGHYDIVKCLGEKGAKLDLQGIFFLTVHHNIFINSVS